MDTPITVNGQQFIPYLTEQEVQQRIKELGQQISTAYEGKTPLFISILNGSFMFSSDLLKHISIPCEICFIKLASYKGTTSTGHVITAIGLDVPVKHRDVIILEDIVDTGKTLATFLPELMNQQPHSLSICCLLHKPEATLHHLNLQYVGFEIPNKFVLGFGLDFDGLGRNSAAIYQLLEAN